MAIKSNGKYLLKKARECLENGRGITIFGWNIRRNRDVTHLYSNSKLVHFVNYDKKKGAIGKRDNFFICTEYIGHAEQEKLIAYGLDVYRYTVPLRDIKQLLAKCNDLLFEVTEQRRSDEISEIVHLLENDNKPKVRKPYWETMIDEVESTVDDPEKIYREQIEILKIAYYLAEVRMNPFEKLAVWFQKNQDENEQATSHKLTTVLKEIGIDLAPRMLAEQEYLEKVPGAERSYRYWAGPKLKKLMENGGVAVPEDNDEFIDQMISSIEEHDKIVDDLQRQLDEAKARRAFPLKAKEIKLKYIEERDTLISEYIESKKENPN